MVVVGSRVVRYQLSGIGLVVVDWPAGGGYYFLCRRPEAKCKVLEWGDKVDSGIGLSYRPAGLHRLADRYDNPMPTSTLSSHSGTMNFATALLLQYLS